MVEHVILYTPSSLFPGVFFLSNHKLLILVYVADVQSFDQQISQPHLLSVERRKRKCKNSDLYLSFYLLFFLLIFLPLTYPFISTYTFITFVYLFIMWT